MASPPSLPPPPLRPPFKKSRVCPFPSLIHRPWILLLFLTILSSAVPSSSPAEIPYADHCQSTVPESALAGSFSNPYGLFHLSTGYFSGGGQLLRPDPADPSSSSFSLPKNFYFVLKSLLRTRTPGVVHITGTLTLRSKGLDMPYWANQSLLHGVRPRLRKSLNWRKTASFDLSGLWSNSTGKLCMVGPGFDRSKSGTSATLSAVFKLNYPKISNISTSLVTGTLESLDATDNSNHFDPISVLTYMQSNYQYTQLPLAKESCSHLDTLEESLGVNSSAPCSHLQYYLGGTFKLGTTSGPFVKSLGLPPPTFMTLNQIQCSEDGRFHMYMSFPELPDYRYRHFLMPDRSLVGEGFWDPNRNQLCLAACRIVQTKGSLANVSVGDCTIGFSLWFPAVLSIKKRHTIVGRIWSNRKMNDSAYFSMVSFQSLDDNFDAAPGLKYEYTELDKVKKLCVKNNTPNSWNRTYPDGKYCNDMSFGINVRNAEGNSVWASASPLFIGKTFCKNSYEVASTDPISLPNVLNVSYRIKYTPSNASTGPTEISAEGLYNPGTGVLCMVGCHYPSSSHLTEKAKDFNSLDCSILISMQLAPLNPDAGEHLNGTIKSTRANSDPLYFEPLEVSSYMMYSTQAAESIWRMDIEIIMVLLSLTLSCILIGVQLFHVKKHPDVLPSISITMLVILTLGHMIPLVLNFEALFFMNRNRQNVLLWSGGWLEVNEVVVRIMTMVTFLLQFRLLQVAWCARSAEEAKKGLWIVERKTLRLCLPLYIAGAFIAWFVHLRFYDSQLQPPHFTVEPHHSLWEDLLSYAGLILDGFLLPQVILNIFWNLKDKALAPIFYIGTTAIRAMPHLYDAYRAHRYVPHLDSSYIYASPDGDFFSSLWDILIPFEGVLFAVIIFLQQCFGGSCILPPRFRKPRGYETVAMVSL